MELEEIVALSVKHNVSDLHLCNASTPRWRRQGKLEPAPFTSPDIGKILADWLNAEQLAQWQACGQVDFALAPAGGPRLRASAFVHNRGLSLALRLLAETCPQLADLGAPAALTELLNEESGLILVTGATGSGKSTTLAAMVGYLNQRLNGHILTLEDPVEFIHHSERCLIQQREIGRHCPSFAAALRAALRQDPDVILLGELRDSETIRLALTAAGPDIWLWRRCIRAVRHRRLKGWWMFFPLRRKSRFVASWREVYARCWHKNCFRILLAEELRYTSFWLIPRRWRI